MKHLTDIEIFEFVEKISSGKELEKISAHIAECPLCREKAELEFALSAALSEQKIILPPANFSSRVMAKVVVSRDETALLRESRKRKISFAVLGILTIAIIAFVVFLQPDFLFEYGKNSSLQFSVSNSATHAVNNLIDNFSGFFVSIGRKLGNLPIALVLVFAALYGLDKFFSRRLLKR